MNGIDYMADTNALIYLLSGDSCMKSYLASYIGLSVISEIELLSFPGITSFEEQQIRSLKFSSRTKCQLWRMLNWYVIAYIE